MHEIGAMDWIVAGVFAVVGMIASIGMYLGLRDPVTRHYKPNLSGYFTIGRSWELWAKVGDGVKG